jgi:PAS domain S-box-containing protein
MTEAEYAFCRLRRAAGLLAAALAPLRGYADTAGGASPEPSSRLYITVGFTVLLLGLLAYLMLLRHLLARRTRALEKHVDDTARLGDELPDTVLFRLEYSRSGGFVFRSISKGYKALMGIDRERLLSHAKLAFDHLYEEDIPALQMAYRVACNTMRPASLKIRALDISGNLKWLHLRAVPHREDDIIIWDGIVQNITEEQLTEGTLREEKRNLQNLFETIDDFMLVCDMHGNLLHANPAVGQRMGYTLPELAEMSLYELYPEHQRTEIYQIVALMQSEESATCGLPFATRNGDLIPVEMNLFQGSWKYRRAIFAIARDTTHRRQTENALRESQQMLQLIMDTIPMSVFWKNRDSVYLGSNKAFLKECGLEDVNDVIGRNPYDLFDEETAAQLVAYDQQVVASNQPMLNSLLPYRRPDTTIGRREANRIPLHNEAGEAVGVLETWRDVTEQNQAEERLKRTVEDMERFNQLMRGRERRTLELKAEVNRLLEELGRACKYQTTADDLS